MTFGETRDEQKTLPRFSFNKLTAPGQELEALVMAAARIEGEYSVTEYIQLRETATLEDLVRAIKIREAMYYQQQMKQE